MEEEKEKSKEKENSEISKKKSSLIIRSSKTKEFSPLKRKTTFALTSIFKTKSSKKHTTRPKKKSLSSRSILQKQSIVYQLPNTGESKSKDYDKISGDIKKLELSIKKEKEYLKKKTITNNLEKTESYSLESSSAFDEEISKTKSNKFVEKYNILEVIQKFKIPPENRTVEDLYITKNYLHQTKLIEFYLNELNNDKRMIENLTTFFGLEFRYQKYQKGEAIYKIDDYADHFYMVLIGKVDIFNVEPKMVNITGYDYFCYIMNLKKNDEKHRYKLCIEENKEIYPISLDDEDLLPYIFLQFIIEDIKEGKKIDDFYEILRLVDLRPYEIGLAENKLNSTEYILQKERRITKKIANFSKDKIYRYRFINNKIIKKHIKIFEYVKINTIEPLNYFGNESIENGTPREETAICAETTELIYIINKLYTNNILPKKALILERKTSFLNKNYLFNKISPKRFIKRYFNLFILETYNKGDILFEENNELEYIYFIKEGNVDLLTSKSILEMEMFINEINKKIKIIQNIFHYGENNEDEKNITLYNNIKSSSVELFEHIKKKEKIKIFILKESEDVGLISYLLGIGHLITGIVESPQALIYKIKKNDLTDILRKERLSFYEIINRVEQKLKVLSQRFYEINNIKLSMTDQRIVEENKIKLDNIKKNKTSEFTSLDIFPTKNKTNVDRDKIKEIIDDHNNNKYNLLLNKNQNHFLALPKLININNINNLFTTSSNIRKSLKRLTERNSIKNIKTIINSYKTNQTEKNKRKTLILENNFNKKKNTLKENIKKLLYYKNKFPYEEEFLMKLTEDMNDLVENKLVLTKKKKIKNNIYDISTNKDTDSYNNTLNNDMYKTNLTKLSDNTKKLLLTQIDNFHHRIKSNNFFTRTENKFRNKFDEKKILNINDAKIFTYTEKLFTKNNNSNDNKIITLNTINNYSSNININETENTSIYNTYNTYYNNTKFKNKNHPYVSPLTMIKLKRYKMLDDKDNFKEKKKRYNKNRINSFEKRGLNQFGFPISYNKAFSGKYTRDKLKNRVLNINRPNEIKI